MSPPRRRPKPDSTTVTLIDVARLAGVSVTTVSHVINETRYVAPDTTERVERAIAELGYEANSAARSLKSGRSRIIGLLITDITNPHYGMLVRGVEEATRQAGYQIILCNSDENPTTELECLRLLPRQGRRRDPAGTDRCASRLLLALSDHGLAEDPELIRDGNSRREDGFQRMLELLDLAKPPTAIFSAHNLTTIGALAALEFRGMHIPEDMAVVGFGDFEWAHFMRSRSRRSCNRRPTLAARRLTC